MQPYSRAPPRTTSSAGMSHGNQSRTNNTRDQPPDRSSDFETISYSDRLGGDGSGLRPSPPGERSGDQNRDVGKLKQITQRFFTKAALTIVSSRVDLPQCFLRDSNQVRSNKWFNLILDESETLAEEVAEWAAFDVTEDAPKPMFIEVYLDTAELARNRTLVVLDERGTKWDICKNLDTSGSGTDSRARGGGKSTQVVLERWKLSLGEPSISRGSGSDSPPNVYKKAVVLFRALYAYLHLMPAWKFSRRIAKEPATLTSLRPMYRIVQAEPIGKDSLSAALYPSGEQVTETRVFEPTKSPAGSLKVQVSYRVNCNFMIDDSDALLSSHFKGMDEHYFRPSLGDVSAQDIPGSLPIERHYSRDMPNRSQAYGSLSTFHRAGQRAGTSPLSALRAVRDLTGESPSESPPQKIPPDHRTSQSSKSSLRSAEGAPPVQRRVSVSFQPFKAGSLSSSPSMGPFLGPSSGSVGTRTSDISKGLAQARNRTSITALPQTALRVPPQPSGDFAVGSPSPSSPKAPPITRYSSSFGHRRSRISSGSATGSRTEEDNNSSGSGRGSQTSTQPGSGLLAEGEGGSGSGQTDEDQIADFLRLLDQKKDLKSFNRSDDASRDASARRTTAALSKFQRLRESHAVLTESLSSSVALQRSSTSSSRAPPLLAGNSVSTSSSPGKPISPHTPHYPAIPSRLSANALIDEPEHRMRSQPRSSRGRMETSTGDNANESRPRGHGSTPMDIPTSPQRYPAIRRSSSAAQRRHASDDMDDFGMRSTSLPLEERPDLSLGEMLALQQQQQQPVHDAPQSSQRDNPMLQSDSRPNTADAPISSSIESHESSRRGGSGSGSVNPLYRPHLGRGGSRGSPSSFGAGSGESSRAGRHSFTTRPGTADDDEPLVFTMSELGTQSRRSLEDVGAVAAERGGTELGSSGNARRAGRRGGNLW